MLLSVIIFSEIISASFMYQLSGCAESTIVQIIYVFSKKRIIVQVKYIIKKYLPTYKKMFFTQLCMYYIAHDLAKIK